MKNNGLVIGWMPYSQRSETIARRMGFELLLLGRKGFRRPWSAVFVYPSLVIKSLLAIMRRRPLALVVVAPPVIAPLVCVPAAKAIGARVAVDIHTGALLDRRWSWSVPHLAWICRRSDAAIVTLPALAELLRTKGVHVFVIPDPLPEFSTGAPESPRASRVRPLVVAVCGWGGDEPIEVLLSSAAGEPWDLVLTGRPKGEVNPPDNVTLSGFLDTPDFVNLLIDADLVVVLTTREHTLLSGAWEALALGRPLLVSATAALRDTFGDAIAAVEPTTSSIRTCVRRALADQGRMIDTSTRLREQFRQSNDAALRTLRGVLDRPT